MDACIQCLYIAYQSIIDLILATDVDTTNLIDIETFGSEMKTQGEEIDRIFVLYKKGRTKKTLKEYIGKESAHKLGIVFWPPRFRYCGDILPATIVNHHFSNLNSADKETIELFISIKFLYTIMFDSWYQPPKTKTTAVFAKQSLSQHADGTLRKYLQTVYHNCDIKLRQNVKIKKEHEKEKEKEKEKAKKKNKNDETDEDENDEDIVLELRNEKRKKSRKAESQTKTLKYHKNKMNQYMTILQKKVRQLNVVSSNNGNSNGNNNNKDKDKEGGVKIPNDYHYTNTNGNNNKNGKRSTRRNRTKNRNEQNSNAIANERCSEGDSESEGESSSGEGNYDSSCDSLSDRERMLHDGDDVDCGSDSDDSDIEKDYRRDRDKREKRLQRKYWMERGRRKASETHFTQLQEKDQEIDKLKTQLYKKDLQIQRLQLMLQQQTSMAAMTRMGKMARTPVVTSMSTRFGDGCVTNTTIEQVPTAPAPAPRTTVTAAPMVAVRTATTGTTRTRMRDNYSGSNYNTVGRMVSNCGMNNRMVSAIRHPQTTQLRELTQPGSLFSNSRSRQSTLVHSTQRRDTHRLHPMQQTQSIRQAITPSTQVQQNVDVQPLQSPPQLQSQSPHQLVTSQQTPNSQIQQHRQIPSDANTSSLNGGYNGKKTMQRTGGIGIGLVNGIGSGTNCNNNSNINSSNNSYSYSNNSNNSNNNNWNSNNSNHNVHIGMENRMNGENFGVGSSDFGVESSIFDMSSVGSSKMHMRPNMNFDGLIDAGNGDCMMNSNTFGLPFDRQSVISDFSVNRISGIGVNTNSMGLGNDSMSQLQRGTSPNGTIL